MPRSLSISIFQWEDSIIQLAIFHFNNWGVQVNIVQVQVITGGAGYHEIQVITGGAGYCKVQVITGGAGYNWVCMLL